MWTNAQKRYYINKKLVAQFFTKFKNIYHFFYFLSRFYLLYKQIIGCPIWDLIFGPKKLSELIEEICYHLTLNDDILFIWNFYKRYKYPVWSHPK